MIIFSKNGIKHKIYRKENEPKKIFNDRTLFIMCQNPKNKKHLSEIITYSNIYINVKYLNCEYGRDIMSKLNWFIKNVTD